MIAIKKPTQLPPRIMLYGPGGVGKTTLAAQAPGAVIIPIEDGASSVPNVATTEQPESWGQFGVMIGELAKDRQGIDWLVIDSVTRLQEMLFVEICKESGVSTIEEALKGFGKGYVAASERWCRMLGMLDKIRMSGCGIILIGHASIKRQADPRLPEYDRLQPRLHVSGAGAGILPSTVEWCDAVLCCNYKVFSVQQGERTVGVGDGERIVYCQERPAYLAKNRFGMTHEIPMRWSAIADSISNHYATKKEAPK